MSLVITFINPNRWCLFYFTVRKTHSRLARRKYFIESSKIRGGSDLRDDLVNIFVFIGEKKYK